MIELKLIPGRYLEFQPPTPPLLPAINPPPGPAAAGPVGVIQPVTPVRMHIDESESCGSPVKPLQFGAGFDPSLFQKAKLLGAQAIKHLESQVNRQTVSTVTVVPGPVKAHRDFLWLQWIEGAVSEVVADDVDVLTGPMTGCWIVRYRRAGQTRVGHVGTSVIADRTTRAKNAWNFFTAAAGMAGGPDAGFPITGFRPSDAWAAGALPVALPDEGGIEIFGLVTAAGAFAAVALAKHRDVRTRCRIVEVRNVHPHLPAGNQIP